MTFTKKDRTAPQLTSTESCPSICCSEALNLIDILPTEEANSHSALLQHVVECPSCRAVWTLESNLRRVIAPKRLPTPSLNFESMLAAQLAISPSIKTVSNPSEVFARNDPIAQWSWVVAAITLSLVGAAQIQKVLSLTTSIPEYFMKLWALVATHITGEVAVAYSYLTRYNFSNSTESISFVMGVTLVAVSFSAARLFFGQDD